MLLMFIERDVAYQCIDELVMCTISCITNNGIKRQLFNQNVIELFPCELGQMYNHRQLKQFISFIL